MQMVQSCKAIAWGMISFYFFSYFSFASIYFISPLLFYISLCFSFSFHSLSSILFSLINAYPKWNSNLKQMATDFFNHSLQLEKIGDNCKRKNKNKLRHLCQAIFVGQIPGLRPNSVSGCFSGLVTASIHQGRIPRQTWYPTKLDFRPFFRFRYLAGRISGSKCS